VLPYSNWQWATLCLSESIQVLRKDVQQALSNSNGCGGISRPKTYGSMAAAHKVPGGQAKHVEGRQRVFKHRVRRTDAAPGDDPGSLRPARRSRTATSRPAMARSSTGSSRRFGARSPRLRERRHVAGGYRRDAAQGQHESQSARRRRPGGDARAQRREATRVRRGGPASQRVEHGARQALRVLGTVAADRRVGLRPDLPALQRCPRGHQHLLGRPTRVPYGCQLQPPRRRRRCLARGHRYLCS